MLHAVTLVIVWVTDDGESPSKPRFMRYIGVFHLHSARVLYPPLYPFLEMISECDMLGLVRILTGRVRPVVIRCS